MESKLLYCITCEDMYPIVDTENPPYHFNFEEGITCEGPFATCPPPKMTEEMWEAVFANEEVDSQI